jgi:hypothetical protein
VGVVNLTDDELLLLLRKSKPPRPSDSGEAAATMLTNRSDQWVDGLCVAASVAVRCGRSWRWAQGQLAFGLGSSFRLLTTPSGFKQRRTGNKLALQNG